NMDWAKKIAESGVKYYIEVANMPTTNDALMFLKEQKHMVVAPSKAVNACGVSVSELEMAQNAERLYWSAEEVDAQMHKIMTNIYNASVTAAEKYGLGYDLIAGANIAGFEKVADAMLCQGMF
ncbi:MAG: NADP-specific glutamate dehydrogenase, partial [Oscillospiraceae bacterium]|nr:NADP-specific glutamate dehydrogenase [Oscillospiraceae bacterium]